MQRLQPGAAGPRTHSLGQLAVVRPSTGERHHRPLVRRLLTLPATAMAAGVVDLRQTSSRPSRTTAHPRLDGSLPTQTGRAAPETGRCAAAARAGPGGSRYGHRVNAAPSESGSIRRTWSPAGLRALKGLSKQHRATSRSPNPSASGLRTIVSGRPRGRLKLRLPVQAGSTTNCLSLRQMLASTAKPSSANTITEASVGTFSQGRAKPPARKVEISQAPCATIAGQRAA